MAKPKPRKRKDMPWVILAWSLNIIGLGAIVLVFVAYLALKPVFASAQGPGLGYTATMPPTFTQDAFSLDLPTITPNPHSTMIVVETATPFIIQNAGTLGNASIASIGYSVSGRPIEVYTFGDGERQKMIVAGIHGGYEWNTIALADELIQYVYENPDVIPDDVTLYIVRNMNPDGDARDHGIDGRVNDHGVDLNRNFPANWAKDWKRDGCWNLTPTTGGPSAGSEPETRAIMYFLQAHKIETLISYHSAALGVFPGGTPWQPDSKKFAKALAKVTSYPYPPVDTGCVYTGTLADYAVSLGTTAVDMELSTHKYTDFDQNVGALKILLNWK